MADTTRPACDDVRDLAAGFVLGSLDPKEMAFVREHLATCDQPHPELEELGSVLPALAASVVQVGPPATLKDRILVAAAAEQARAAQATGPARDATLARETAPARDAAPPSPAGRPARLGFLDVFRRPAWAAAGMAAVLAVGLLGAWNARLQSQLQDAAAYRAGVAAVLGTAAAPGGRLAVLTAATGGAAAGIAALGADGHVALAMRDLDPTTGAEVYEAWVIGADGRPIPVGSFQVGEAGSGILSASISGVSESVVVALTREPGPGATAPTLPILAQGQVRLPPG